MANKIKLNVKQWLKIAARGLLVLIVLLILEVGVLYGAHFSTADSKYFLIITVLNLILWSIVTYQQYLRYQVLQLLIQFQDVTPVHVQRLGHLKVHNHWLRRVLQQLLLITKAMQTAIQQEQNSELRKDELITNVSHDLRTPLTSILGFLGLIEQNPHTSNSDIKKYVHIAFQKAQQLQILVNDLFEYVRASSASTKLNYRKFDMIQMLEQVDAEFELQAQQKHIQISVTSPEKTLVMRADTEKLGRVFNNLVTNALQYGQGAHHIWLKVQDRGQFVWLQVANDGEPIPEDSLPRLFERFYRSDQARSPVHSGTGLGLAIAQSLIKIHGGKISVQSDANLTAFDIILPKNFTQDTK